MNNNLLTSTDFANIRDNLNDVMFTFLKRPITYKKDSNTNTRWQKDNAVARQYTNISLNGLVVWGTSNEDFELKTEITGAKDFGEGYVLLRYDDCTAQGIVTAGNFTTTTPQDKIAFNGVDYYVRAIVMSGQLENEEVLVKVFFRKDLLPG